MLSQSSLSHLSVFSQSSLSALSSRLHFSLRLIAPVFVIHRRTLWVPIAWHWAEWKKWKIFGKHFILIFEHRRRRSRRTRRSIGTQKASTSLLSKVTQKVTFVETLFLFDTNFVYLFSYPYASHSFPVLSTANTSQCSETKNILQILYIIFLAKNVFFLSTLFPNHLRICSELSLKTTQRASEHKKHHNMYRHKQLRTQSESPSFGCALANNCFIWIFQSLIEY